jgi:hypothetical protein
VLRLSMRWWRWSAKKILVVILLLRRSRVDVSVTTAGGGGGGFGMMVFTNAKQLRIDRVVTADDGGKKIAVLVHETKKPHDALTQDGESTFMRVDVVHSVGGHSTVIRVPEIDHFVQHFQRLGNCSDFVFDVVRLEARTEQVSAASRKRRSSEWLRLGVLDEIFGLLQNFLNVNDFTVEFGNVLFTVVLDDHRTVALVGFVLDFLVKKINFSSFSSCNSVMTSVKSAVSRSALPWPSTLRARCRLAAWSLEIVSPLRCCTSSGFCLHQGVLERRCNNWSDFSVDVSMLE